MSNGGSLMDSITGLFSSGGGGGKPSPGSTKDPVEARMERVEQVAEGVRMAAAALEDDLKELRREAGEAAEEAEEAVGAVEAARERGPVEGDAGPSRETIGALDRCIEALEELHYLVVRVEVHPEVESDEERERAAAEAAESVERVREAADSMTETAEA